MLSRRRFLMLAAGSMCAMAAPAWLTGCSAGQNDGNDGAAANDAADSAAYEVQSLTLFLFDTVIQISALCAPELMDRISERCQFFEDRFSRTKEGSDIWNINQAHGAPVEVSEETARCIDDDAIEEAVTHVDYRAISVDGTTVTLADPDAMLDLGGIAKGFITDDLVSMLREAGCKSAMLSLGGNVYVLGESFRGDDWNVGVQDPNGTANDVIASIPARDKSLVTSGLYERSFTVGDVLYYHILDPRTGYPVKTDLASASIVSDSSTDGDAYSTTLFLMGHDKAMELLNSDERFSGLLVDMNDTATASDGSGFTLLNE